MTESSVSARSKIHGAGNSTRTIWISVSLLLDANRPQTGLRRSSRCANPVPVLVHVGTRAVRIHGTAVCVFGPSRQRSSCTQMSGHGLARLASERPSREQVVGDMKTEGSARTFAITATLLERLKTWKRQSDFSGGEDWIFASPIKLGRLPYSYVRLAGTCAGRRRRKDRAPRHARLPGHSPLMP